MSGRVTTTGVMHTDIEGLPLLGRGKVRDIYRCGDELLLIATDRISAFDVVMPQPIPDKGKILNQISAFWFDWVRPIVPSHLITIDVADYPAVLAPHRALLRGRSALVHRATMFPIECVARGYLAGSGLKEYRARGTVCGIPLPAGLIEADRLPQPIFTPATKEESGHDINISFDDVVRRVGGEVAEELRRLTLAIFVRASAHAESRGLILADTKFEFGWIDGTIHICDEMLTPDSSRFWPAAAYRPGSSPPSFDKQFLRDYLETLDWPKTPPAPDLPEAVLAGTRARYLECAEKLMGRTPEL